MTRTTTAIGVDIHFGPDSIGHKYYPGGDKCHAYGVLKIDSGGVTYANLYLEPAHIDKMIAELVALKQEMDPPVITDSERTCPEVRDGWHCHRSGDHGVHEDDNGDLWRTDQPAPNCGTKHHAERYRCTVPKGHEGPHQARGPEGELYASWYDLPAPSAAQETATEMAEVIR